jgi:hypothetical protein
MEKISDDDHQHSADVPNVGGRHSRHIHPNSTRSSSNGPASLHQQWLRPNVTFRIRQHLICQGVRNLHYPFSIGPGSWQLPSSSLECYRSLGTPIIRSRSGMVAPPLCRNSDVSPNRANPHAASTAIPNKGKHSTSTPVRRFSYGSGAFRTSTLSFQIRLVILE